MRIPEVRARLHVLATTLRCPELDTLADELVRRSPLRQVARRKYPALTPLQKTNARVMYFVDDMNITEIAIQLKTNNGRVSEAIHGFRT